MNEFGNLVKKMLIDKNMTQTELAKRINMSFTGFNNLLNRDTLQLDKMKSIADALNCDLVIELKPRGEGNGK